MKNINLNVPPQFNIFVLKNEKKFKIYLCNNNIKFNLIFKINNNKIVINKYNNFIKIYKKNVINNNVLINNTINKFLKLINVYEYVKIKFKGKGFKLGFYKKNKFLNFFFGSSHINMVFFNKVMLKKINKYKFIIKNTDKKKLNKLITSILNIKKINFYTLRGLRMSRQKIIKRKGRKGTFI